MELPCTEAVFGEEVPAAGDSQGLIEVDAAHRLFQPPVADSVLDQLHRFTLPGHERTPAVRLRAPNCTSFAQKYEAGTREKVQF